MAVETRALGDDAGASFEQRKKPVTGLMNDQNVAGAEILQCFLFGTRHAQIAAGGITIGTLPLHQDIAHQMHLEQVGSAGNT